MWLLISISVGVGILLGWIYRGKEARKWRQQVIVEAHNQIIADGFNKYQELTGELHPSDPRNVILEVVDISHN